MPAWITSLLREDTPLPIPGVFSATTTAWPSIARARAQASPTTPAPTTRTSIPLRYHAAEGWRPSLRDALAPNPTRQGPSWTTERCVTCDQGSRCVPAVGGLLGRMTLPRSGHL